MNYSFLNPSLFYNCRHSSKENEENVRNLFNVIIDDLAPEILKDGVDASNIALAYSSSSSFNTTTNKNSNKISNEMNYCDEQTGVPRIFINYLSSATLSHILDYPSTDSPTNHNS